MPPAPLPAHGTTAPAASAQRPPAACDVLVIGAGPAGSACAQHLARAGRHVVLVDQQPFPRDKVCGDGLIPDAHRALQRLGVHDEVMALAQRVSHVGCVGPRGGRVDVPGHLAVLPRRQLDDILKRAAERAGAAFHAPWRFDAPLEDNGRVVGARLAGPPHADTAQGNAKHDLRARWVVLATGAVPKALIGAGMCLRQVPTGVALRGYIRHAALAEHIRALEVVWHKRLRLGYGWIFPCGDGVFNIGVGLAHSHRQLADGHGAMADVNLRDLFRTFTEVYAPARALVDGGRWTGPLKGAPLRCSLEGARAARAGLLVTGEAIGSTYAFTGEGIGKALETGLLAAEALLLPGADRVDADDRICAHYGQALDALRPRYDLYERANRINDHPWLADLLIWRAQRHPGILRRMAGVLEETYSPGRLVTASGLLKLILPIG